MDGTVGTETSVGEDISAYLRDIRFLILSSTVDFRAFCLVEGDFASFEMLRLMGWRESEGRRVRSDCIPRRRVLVQGAMNPNQARFLICKAEMSRFASRAVCSWLTPLSAQLASCVLQQQQQRRQAVPLRSS